MSGLPKTVRVVGTGATALGKHQLSATKLMQFAMEHALSDAKLDLKQLNGLVAVPSLSEPRFMQAHYLATMLGILPDRSKLVKTIDTGGAGPITGINEAAEMIRKEQCEVVAVVAGDAVSSLPVNDFLERADAGCQDPEGSLPSPVIPSGYDRVAQWQMKTYGVTREQLGMCSVIMSHQAQHHPHALTRKPHSLDDVLGSRNIGKVTGLLECARRADGAACVILASSRYLNRIGLPAQSYPVLLGSGEASGPLYPPRVIDESMFSCEAAARFAYEEAGCFPEDIDYFSLYDCFPICFLRALEAVGVADKGKAGAWIEDQYTKITENPHATEPLPINTHGGLLAFGAPWETPALFGFIEAVQQLNGTATGRQVKNARRALVYGNGGIFSASAVAILGRGRNDSSAY